MTSAHAITSKDCLSLTQQRKLIYTPATASDEYRERLDTEGTPKFVRRICRSNWRSEIKVTARKSILAGNHHDVYVVTKWMEFNYPQGETNNLTSYEGTGYRRRFLFQAPAIRVGFGRCNEASFRTTLRRKSLIHRNIREIVDGVAPFLYDNDHMWSNPEGRLSDHGRVHQCEYRLTSGPATNRQLHSQ